MFLKILRKILKIPEPPPITPQIRAGMSNTIGQIINIFETLKDDGFSEDEITRKFVKIFNLVIPEDEPSNLVTCLKIYHLENMNHPIEDFTHESWEETVSILSPKAQKPKPPLQSAGNSEKSSAGKESEYETFTLREKIDPRDIVIMSWEDLHDERFSMPSEEKFQITPYQSFDYIRMILRFRLGDEFWGYSTSNIYSFSSGLALVRDGKVIDAIQTMRGRKAPPSRPQE